MGYPTDDDFRDAHFYSPPPAQLRKGKVKLAKTEVIGKLEYLRAAADGVEFAEFLKALQARFCFGCGVDQPKKGRKCQCENDE